MKKATKRTMIMGLVLMLVLAVGISTAFAASNPPTLADKVMTSTESAPKVEAVETDAPKETVEAEEPMEAKEAKEADEDEDVAALAGKATLTEQQAIDAALAANPGATVVSVKLGDENGVVIYEVEIADGNGEIKVDANTGTILPEDNNSKYEG